jgi:hypothetical protein
MRVVGWTRVRRLKDEVPKLRPSACASLPSLARRAFLACLGEARYHSYAGQSRLMLVVWEVCTEQCGIGAARAVGARGEERIADRSAADGGVGVAETGQAVFLDYLSYFLDTFPRTA